MADLGDLNRPEPSPAPSPAVDEETAMQQALSRARMARIAKIIELMGQQQYPGMPDAVDLLHREEPIWFQDPEEWKKQV